MPTAPLRRRSKIPMRSLKLSLILLPLIAVMLAVPARTQEMRGAWVTAWVAGFFTAEQADATVAAAKRAGLSALFIQVRKNADAYYFSDTEPRGNGIAPDFDPLACVIEKAHAQGIEVHAWMNAGRIWSSKEPPTDPKHIANRHPEWLNKDFRGNTRASEGLYLDLGIPGVRDYVSSVAEEIARKYDVDGIHLDYIRYPGKDWGYSDAALAGYFRDAGVTKKPETTDTKWLQWKRDRVTDLVRLVRKKVHSAKPGLIISASTIPWGDCPAEWTATSPYASVSQDWRRWTEQGLIDANCPMNYKQEKNPKHAQQFRNWLAGFKRWSGGKDVYVGLDTSINSPEEIVRQIEAVRRAGLAGFILFPFNQSARREALVQVLRAGPCAGPQPGGSRAAFQRGVRHGVANQLDLAKQCFQEAIELDPGYAEAHFRLGRCYLREGDTAKAKELFEKTLSLDPSHAGAKRELKSL